MFSGECHAIVWAWPGYNTKGAARAKEGAKGAGSAEGQYLEVVVLRSDMVNGGVHLGEDVHHPLSQLRRVHGICFILKTMPLGRRYAHVRGGLGCAVHQDWDDPFLPDDFLFKGPPKKILVLPLLKERESDATSVELGPCRHEVVHEAPDSFLDPLVHLINPAGHVGERKVLALHLMWSENPPLARPTHKDDGVQQTPQRLVHVGLRNFEPHVFVQHVLHAILRCLNVLDKLRWVLSIR